VSRVYSDPARTAREIVAGFAELGVATVHEAQDRTGLMRPHMRPIYPGARAAGTAVTVSLAPADNLMLHVVVEQCQAGDIVVAAPTSSASCSQRHSRRALSGASCSRADLIVADDDGVVVVPRERAEIVLAASRARDQKEGAVRTRLAAGELGLDIYGMRDKLARKGLTYMRYRT
jgi:4-hydroxy-4-methyl-2-oxoglutarate aldolase